MRSNNLPEFAFLKGFGDDDQLNVRNVILHIPTASIMEVFEQGTPIEDDMLTLEFKRYNHFLESITGREYEENYIIALLSSSSDMNNEHVIRNILKPASMWFCDFNTFMDNSLTEKDIL